ncbi:MAG: trigger factor [Coriobacteriia bacterium]|nr:trigger factor [Coriobacteriia bacterium]MCL2749923.1 trigger factor [Coriobacteriia bacterium]
MKHFKLGPYKDLQLTSFDTVASESEVNEAIGYIFKSMEEAKIEKVGGIEEGDQVVVTWEATDERTGINLVKETVSEFCVGDEQESFPEALIPELMGHKVGDVIDFSKTIELDPFDFHFQDYIGQTLLFKLVVKEVYFSKRLELTDELVVQIDPNLKTIADLKLLLADEIHQRKAEQQRDGNITIMFQALIDQCEFEFDDEVIEQDAKELYYNFAAELNAEDDMLAMNEYLAAREISAGTLLAECKEEVAKTMLRNAILEEVILAENITLTAEEIEQTEKKFADDQEKDWLPEELNNVELVKSMFLCKKALDYLLEVNFTD